MTARGYVVTGGTGALGRAVVRRLLADGSRVAVPFRDAEGWEALRTTGTEATLWGAAADVADLEAAGTFMDAAAGWLGRLDGVAALAGGYSGTGTLEAAAPSEWDDMLRSNLRATYATCRAALPHLLRAGGCVVTVGSRNMETGASGAAAYAVSKAGVLALTRSLALENRDRGVRFNLVAPGTIDTPANRRAMPKADASRWVPPEAIAEVVAFLLSPASSPVSGAVVPVYGRS